MIGGVAALPVAKRVEAMRPDPSSLLPGASQTLNVAPIPAMNKGELDWVKEMLGEFLSGKAARETRDELRYASLTLDPDLASSRSLSLSAAMRIQREREVARRLQRSRSYYEERFKALTGLPWSPTDV